MTYRERVDQLTHTSVGLLLHPADVKALAEDADREIAEEHKKAERYIELWREENGVKEEWKLACMAANQHANHLDAQFAEKDRQIAALADERDEARDQIAELEEAVENGGCANCGAALIRIEQLEARFAEQAAEIARHNRVETLEAQVAVGEMDEVARLKARLAEREWQPIETAPKDGKFLVCDASSRMMVADGIMLALSRQPTTPQHLSGHHWTRWMPLPTVPTETETGCAEGARDGETAR